MGNQVSEEKEPRRDGQTSDVEPARPAFISEVQDILALVSTMSDVEGRASAIASVFERLLKSDAEAFIWNYPSFRLVSIEKAYEASEHPFVAAIAQEYLYKFHPEAFGRPCPKGCGLPEHDEVFEQWADEASSGEDLGSEEEESVARVVEDYLLKGGGRSDPEPGAGLEVDSDGNWPEGRWIAHPEGSQTKPEAGAGLLPKSGP